MVLTGEHDYGSKGRVEQVLAELHGHVLIDLTDCDLIDTSIINVLLTKHRELQRAGFKLELIIPSTQVHLSRTFDLLGIRNLVTIREDRPLSM